MSLRVTIHVELLDPFNRELFMLQRDLIGVWCEFVCELHDDIWEGSGEENDLHVPREKTVNISRCKQKA